MYKGVYPEEYISKLTRSGLLSIICCIVFRLFVLMASFNCVSVGLSGLVAKVVEENKVRLAKHKANFF